jgi:3-oxoacyl-[acyl-carrier protein] reductase
MADEGNLTGKVAVVTGATGGIGSASAKRLAAAGATVVVGYNSKADEARQLASTLPGSGHRAIRMRLEETPTLEAMASEVKNAYGRADILINTAGFTRAIPHGDLASLTDDFIDAIFIANVRGPFAVIRALAPLLRAGGDGVIVNISSLAALSGSGSNIAYGGAKAALDTMSMSLARVLGAEVRVISVSPGGVDTDFVPGRTRAALEQQA